jgi:clan AA aspartic protease (TIGR02281 family)
MKHHLSFILALCLFLPAMAQEVLTKDGVSLGNREKFISNCTSSATQKTMEVNGISINTENYCACIADNLIPTLSSTQIKDAASKSKLTDLFLEENNLDILMKCLDGNYTIGDNYKFERTDNTAAIEKVAVKSCVKGIMEDSSTSGKWTEAMVEKYCACAIEKMYAKGFSFKDVENIENENSAAFNEIALPCASEFLVETGVSTNTYIAKDITGSAALSKVALVDYMGKGYKVKIVIDGVIRYYLFDTGASDLIIDTDIERELLLNRSLSKEDYLEKQEYTMANNEVVQAQMVRLHNVQIGDFTANNVIAAVLDKGSLLCGKGFLDKFKKWELDKDKKLLILYK